MSDAVHFERGEFAVGIDDELGGAWITGAGPEACVGPLTVDELRWIVTTAGPAVLYELQREEVAGDGGGPSPAMPDATGPADGPEPDDPEPDLFASIPDDRADPHTVACPSCKSPRGTACMTPGGMVARTHAARRRFVEG